MMDRVKLEGMEFFASHGCEAEERKYRQRIIVDVAMYYDVAEAARHDDIKKAVDYAAVFDTVRDVCEGHSYALIETIAESVASAVLEKYAPIKKVRVTVHKPDAPLSGKFADVNVAISRERA